MSFMGRKSKLQFSDSCVLGRIGNASLSCVHGLIRGRVGLPRVAVRLFLQGVLSLPHHPYHFLLVGVTSGLNHLFDGGLAPFFCDVYCRFNGNSSVDLGVLGDGTKIASVVQNRVVNNETVGGPSFR